MKKTQSNTALGWLVRKAKRQLPIVILLGILNMVSAASFLWLALLSKDLIDAANLFTALPAQTDIWAYLQRPEIAGPAIRVVVLIVLQVVLSIVLSNLRIRAAGRLEIALKRSVFTSLMNADYVTVQAYHSGELLNRLTSDASLVAKNATTLVPSTLSMATRLIGGLIVLATISPWFAVGIVTVGALVMLGTRLYGGYLKKLHKICQESDGRTRSFMQEVLTNLLTVKAFSNQPYMQERLETYQNENFRQRVRRTMIGNFGNTGVYLLLTVAYYIALLCGVALMIAGRLSVGTLAALLQIFEQMQAPLRNASGILPQYYAMIASAERLRELEQLESETATALPTSRETLFSAFTQLSMADLTFAYEGHAPVLEELSFQIKRGEIIALVGESGIGKSTLIKLVLALLTPDAGGIVLRCDSRRLAVDASTRVFFSYVPQGNTVLSGTLRENVAFFRPNITDDRIREALRLACLEDFTESLQDGLDTVVGEHGYGVSEGQAQRIAIARALLNDAPILLLDECTSALDVDTEQQLLSNIRELTDKTVLMVSHKSTAVAGCDRVLRLADGKLTEE